MSKPLKAFLLIEIAVCFIPALLLLVLGLLMLPVQVWFLLTRSGEISATGPMMLIGLVFGGTAGLVALVNVWSWLWSPASAFLGRQWTLLGAFAGAAALAPWAFGPVDSNWWRLLAWMPLACTAHLLYLARTFLFSGANTR